MSSKTSRDNNQLPNIIGLKQKKPRHSLGYRVSHIARTITANALIAILAFTGTVAAATYLDINSTIEQHQVKVISQSKVKTEEKPIDAFAGQPISFVLIGQDTRSGDNLSVAQEGSEDLHNADTTMVVQISADRSYVNIVSIPRDSMVNAPSCNTSKGTVPARYHVMFNSIFAYGYQYGG
ncbi:MAG: LCP family protein, partial [Bifidobacteriaceae bacterium]|nr:LCP family protein [Bifidobacteriaceae bacterium]